MFVFLGEEIDELLPNLVGSEVVDHWFSMNSLSMNYTQGWEMGQCS